MVPIERIEARAYEMPTDAPEADGTAEWDSTTLVAFARLAEAERFLLRLLALLLSLSLEEERAVAPCTHFRWPGNTRS